jgi:aconitate hydratase 2/2-methylisocitrate dehydratase
MPGKITATVFKVTDEKNTDDLSPAPGAMSCPDVPLHARAAFKMTLDGLTPKKPGEVGALAQIEEIKAKANIIPALNIAQLT